LEAWLDINPKTLAAGLDTGEIRPESIIDVRESNEWDYYHLPGTTHMPMNSIPSRLNELPKEEELYILCAHGIRSVYVCRYLHEQGYGNLRNISGGIASIALLNGFRYD
jgi:rhodanese-related sulfurtransferase